MPIENGKINWWALATILVAMVGPVLGWSLTELRSGDRELFKTMISQQATALDKHMTDQAKYATDQKEILKELRVMNEKQDVQITELKDTVKTICWSISMPFESRRKAFEFPSLQPFKNGKP